MLSQESVSQEYPRRDCARRVFAQQKDAAIFDRYCTAIRPHLRISIAVHAVVFLPWRA